MAVTGATHSLKQNVHGNEASSAAESEATRDKLKLTEAPSAEKRSVLPPVRKLKFPLSIPPLAATAGVECASTTDASAAAVAATVAVVADERNSRTRYDGGSAYTPRYPSSCSSSASGAVAGRAATVGPDAACRAARVACNLWADASVAGPGDRCTTALPMAEAYIDGTATSRCRFRWW